MGSKLVWIAAALAYGAVCAAIYVLLSRHAGKRRLMRRAVISFCGFTAFGMAAVYVLWRIFAI